MKKTDFLKKLTAVLLAVLMLAGCAFGATPSGSDIPAGAGETKAPESDKTDAPQSSELNEPEAPADPVNDRPESAIVLLSNNSFAVKDAQTQVSKIDTAFSFDFFKRVTEQLSENGRIKNSVMSPLSAYYALAMLMNGCKGDTAAELEKALGSDADQAAAFLKKLSDDYKTMSESSNTYFNVANSAFYDDRLILSEDDIFDRLRYFFGADSYKCDIDTDETKDFINSWVNEKTDGMIPELLGEKLDAETIFVLLNAVLLDAEWEYPFINDGYDRTCRFTNPDGAEYNTKALRDERMMTYIDTDEVLGAVMDYSGSRLKFCAMMPKDGDLAGFINGLDPESFSELLAGAKREVCNFSMPVFNIESSMNLNDTMKAMGINAAFDANLADLTGFGTSSNGNIFVSQIFQKAKIEVNEQGTKAAAVTEIVAADTALFEARNVSIDHSFCYVIYDSETDMPLFMGVVTDPEMYED